MDITSSAQCSLLINNIADLSNQASKLRADLAIFDETQSINDVHAALTAGGAVFPPTFTLTPAIVEDARFALGTLRSSFDTAMDSVTNALDKVRLSLGVLTGTG